MHRIDRSVLPIPDEVLSDRPGANAESAVNLSRLAPPENAPNIVIVLIDDMGFAASSSFGGPCHMPTADKLAAGGLKYSRFHTTALCSPTRQALMTGRNHHSVNMGTISNMATPVPGYTSVRPKSAATMAEVLRMNGYNTGAFGKMHQTPPWEASPVGPFDRWPTGEGFEKFYGFVGGEANQWDPAIFDGTNPVDYPDEESYHFSEDMTTKSIDWVKQQQALAPETPFFLYLSFGATHAPHHVPQSWIEKYKGRFDHGWDEERERIIEAQRQAGLVPEDCVLTSRHEEIPAWDALNEAERKVAARLMEAYAGFAEHTDAQVGRLVASLEELEVMDNTIVWYILGDNGASAEGGDSGTFNEVASLNGVHDSTENILGKLDLIGSRHAYNHYPAGWAHATNTPYQWTKQVASHWGGTRVGMIAHWPSGISDQGGVRHQWHHVIDVMPTVLQAAGLPEPEVVNGTPQQRTDGISMMYTFEEPDAQDRRTTQYFEMFGNRGIYHEGWTACTRHAIPWRPAAKLPAFDDDKWELYAPSDWSQANDVSSEHPQKLAEMQALFLVEAERNNVLPLDDRRTVRFNPDLAGRPDVLGGRTRMRLLPGMTRLTETAIPNVKNKSHVITARVTLLETPTDGAILSQGGRFGGWSLYFIDGVPHYTHNWLGYARYDLVGNRRISPGQHELRYEFVVDDSEGFGNGGYGTLSVDGVPVANGRINQTVPFHFSSSATTDVGCDRGAPVVDEYRTKRGEFTGEIDWVDVSIDGEDSPIPPQIAFDIEMSTE